jgi:hypothetical protein
MAGGSVQRRTGANPSYCERIVASTSRRSTADDRPLLGRPRRFDAKALAPPRSEARRRRRTCRLGKPGIRAASTGVSRLSITRSITPARSSSS